MDKDISFIVNEAMKLKEEISEKKEQLAVLSKEIARAASFKEGSSTGHIYTPDCHVKVSKKTSVKWDQNLLNQARTSLNNDDLFAQIFKWEWKPRDNKALKTFLSVEKNQDCVNLINQAMVVTDSAPYITFEKVEKETC